MPRVVLTAEQCENYAEWIRGIRDNLNKTQAELLREVYYLDFDKEGNLCWKGYKHRNSVGNWENGRNLPLGLETFVLFALLDKDGDVSKNKKALTLNQNERVERLVYVQDKMKEILGRKMYCRNLGELILMSWCMGIIGFDDVTDIKEELLDIIKKEMSVDALLDVLHKEKLYDNLSKEDLLKRLSEEDEFIEKIEPEKISEKNKTEDDLQAYGRRRDTLNIYEDLRLVQTKTGLKFLIAVWKTQLGIGYRTIGERLKARVERKYEIFQEIDFSKIVEILAPQYKNTYRRMWECDCSISREWILDLCYHLGLDEEEIDATLEDVQMIPFSEIDRIPCRYIQCMNLDINKKLAYAVLLGYFIAKEDTKELCLPIDYYLDYLMYDDKSRQILRLMQGIKDGYLNQVNINPDLKEKKYVDEKIDKAITAVTNMVEMLYSFSENTGQEQDRFYQQYQSIFDDYYNGNKIYFYASLLYSLFTGKLITGKVTERDWREVEQQFEEQWIYNFLDFLWDGYLVGKNGSKLMVSDWEKNLSFMCEAWMMTT